MSIYEVGVDVRFKEYGVKRPVTKELLLWVEDKGADQAVKKAKKYAMAKKGWDMGYPLSVKLLSVCKRGRIDVR